MDFQILNVFCWQILLFRLSNQANVMHDDGKMINVTSCEDVIQFYQYIGFVDVDDCDVEPRSKSLLWRVDNKLTWQQARETCGLVVGGDLASLKTFALRRLALSLIADKPPPQANCWTWTGIHRVNGSLVFVDNSTVPQNRWWPGEENNGDCAVSIFNYDGKPDDSGMTFGWYTEDCSNRNVFLCQISI